MGKLFIRLQRHISGVDHLKAIDPEKFAEFHHRWDSVAENLDADRINDFYVYEGENGKYPTRWFRASKGLKAVRSVLEFYRASRGTLSEGDRQATIDLFQIVESILDDADIREVRFCFVGDY